MIYQNLHNSSRNRRGLGELKWPTSDYKPHLVPFSFPSLPGRLPSISYGREGPDECPGRQTRTFPAQKGESCSGNGFSPQLYPQAACNQGRGYLPRLPAPARLLPCSISGSGDLGTAPGAGLRSLAPLEGSGWEKLRHSAPGLRPRTPAHSQAQEALLGFLLFRRSLPGYSSHYSRDINHV